MQDSSEVSENNTASVGKSSKRKRAKRKRGQQWAYYVESFKRTVDCLYEICRSDHNINGCKEAIIYLENSKRDFESLINTIKVETSWDESTRPQAVAWEIRKSTRSPVEVALDSLTPILIKDNARDPQCEEDDDFKEAIRLSLDDEWQVVLPRRRRSTSSSSGIPVHRDSVNSTPSPQQRTEVVEAPRPNVYDRLSAPRRTISPSVGNATPASPRPSAIRSSSSSQPARLTCPRSAMDLPQTKASMAKMAYSRQLLWERNQSMLAEKLRAKQRMERVDRQRRRAGPTRCGIHFADRSPAQRTAGSFRQCRQGNSAPVSERNPSVDRSLQSINEVGEGDEMEAVPADPTPTDPSKDRDNARFSATRSEPAFGEVSSLLGLDDDVEWKEMTEEEESLALEEHSLNLEIEHEESFSIDVELERQVAAEAEALEKFELSQKAAFSTNQDKLSNSAGCDSTSGTNLDRTRDDIRRRPILTWSEVVGRELVAPYREPGTVAERHEKMSSPSRRRCEKDDADFSSRHAEKLRRATELREQLQAEKTARLRELARRVEEVREKRQKVIERKRLLLESRMERAQENREKNITEIIRRAKDDEQKVLEVQFINSLQGGNMLLDLRMRDAGVEERKQTLAEERARRMEEKAAKEHAAEERRKLAELERIARLQEIAEKKEARHAQIAAQRNEQERLRNERRKQQQEKLNELRIADAEENESRRKRIQEKIESSSRRHEQTLEEVRVRAQEFSSPRPPSGCRWTWSFVDCCHWPSDSPGTTFSCSQCSTKMSTELEAVAHVMSQAHLSKVNIDLLQVSTDDLEREFCALSQTPTSECGDENGEDDSAWRKKRAKVKQRLAARNKKIAELTETPPSPGRQARCLRDLTNVIAKCQQKSNRLDDSTLQMLDRSLSDCYREAQSQEWFAANISQYFNNSSVLPDLLGFLIKWTTTGANARLLRKISAFVCRVCSAPSFCRSILFTHMIVELIDNTVLLLKSCEGDSDQLLCLLDVLLTIICCARNVSGWKILKVDDHELEVRISMIASYLLSCRLPHVLKNVVTPTMTPPLFEKLTSIHQEIAGIVSEDTVVVATAFCDLLLKAAVSAVRSQPSSVDATKIESCNPEHFVEAAIRMCARLSKDPTCWKMLLESPEMSVRILLLLGHIIRSIDKETGSSTPGVTPSLQLTALELTSQYTSFSLSHQVSCVLGGQRSLLAVVASLPVFYLTRPSLRILFVPALISMTHGNRLAMQLLLEEMSEKHVTKFIAEAQAGQVRNINALDKIVPGRDFDSLLRFYQVTDE